MKERKKLYILIALITLFLLLLEQGVLHFYFVLGRELMSWSYPLSMW